MKHNCHDRKRGLGSQRALSSTDRWWYQKPKLKIKPVIEVLQNVSFLDDTTVTRKGNGTVLQLQRLFSCVKIGAKVVKYQKEFFFSC